jgi:hypothetical protein
MNQIGANQSIRQKSPQAPSYFVGGLIVTAHRDLAYDRFERFEIAKNDFQNRSIEVCVRFIGDIRPHGLSLASGLWNSHPRSTGNWLPQNGEWQPNCERHILADCHATKVSALESSLAQGLERKQDRNAESISKTNSLKSKRTGDIAYPVGKI